LQKDIVARPGSQGRSKKVFARDKDPQQPCNSDACPIDRPKHETEPLRASDLSSGVGDEVKVTTDTSESAQRIKLKMSVEGLSDSEVLLINEAGNPARRLVPDVQDSDMRESKLLNTMQVPSDQSRNSHWNSRVNLAKQAQGQSLSRSEHVLPENPNEDWDAVGTALKNNDSTFNMKNISRTGLWPARPTLRTRTIFHTPLSQYPANNCFSRSQSLSADTSRKVVFPVQDGIRFFCLILMAVAFNS
jgi:hypothetical protein